MLGALDALIAFVTVILAASLLVTTLVQIVQSSLNLRGKSLAWSLTRMFQQMPGGAGLTADEARVVVDTLLQLPGVSASGKGRGQTLDPRLLPLLLADVAERLATASEQREARAALPAGVDRDTLVGKVAMIRDQIAGEQARGVTARELLAWYDEDRAAARAAATGPTAGAPPPPPQADLVAELKQALASDADEAVRFLKQRTDRATARFDHFMTAARERFKKHAQGWALALALVLCIVYRIDAFQALRTLHQDPEAARAYAERVHETWGGEILATSSAAERLTFGRELWDAFLAEWEAAGEDPSALERPDDVAPRSPEDWIDHVRRQASAAGASSDLAESVFERAWATHMNAVQQRLIAQGRTLLGQLADAPAPVLRPRTAQDWTDLSGLLGWLLTGVLVSLGAPFWFNILNRLTNLRPILASALETEGRAEGEAKEAKKPRASA